MEKSTFRWVDFWIPRVMFACPGDFRGFKVQLYIELCWHSGLNLTWCCLLMDVTGFIEHNQRHTQTLHPGNKILIIHVLLSELTSHWIYTDIILDIHWHHTGYTLTSHWIYTDIILDIHWHHTGYTLTLDWIHTGFTLAP